MSSTRTQVYLTEDQRKQVDALAEARGVSMAEIIRSALDRYFEHEVPDPHRALAETFGAIPNADIPSRDEWNRG